MTSKRITRQYCIVGDCIGLNRSHGYCGKHEQRLRKHGNLNRIRWHGVGETTEERFWSRVAITADNDRCWLWLGSTNQDGYGRFNRDGKVIQAHRYAWKLANGREPDGLVLHHCDTPRCVNAKHLYVGTDADNARDRSARNRVAKGERSGKAKLTVADVKIIKQLLQQNVRSVIIAKMFPHVTDGAIRGIKRGVSWAHVQI